MTLRTFVARVVLVCASISLALLLVELSLRVLYPAPIRFFYPQEIYDFDPEIGHVLRPRQLSFTFDRPVQTNSLGLRDREIAPYPTPGTLRVLALGDSQTFGNGLDPSETWPKQLERMLQNLDGGRRWEVMNAGIPATDTWQHEIVLGWFLDTIHPNAVVLAFYVNDVAPRYDPHNVNASELTNSRGKRLAYVLKRSALVTWVYYGLLLPLQVRGSDGRSIEDAVITGDHNEAAERGWRQVEQSLAAMKQRCEARQVLFLVAILPRRDQISGDNSSRGYNARAITIGEKHGIAMLDLLPDLSTAYRLKGASLFIPWDGHNAAAANEVIATRLAARLSSVTDQLARR
jgi:lysophospholipase L1-like esterase